MTAQLADSMGARHWPAIADKPDYREHYADAMAAFMAAAIVDLAGLKVGDPFDRLAQAINALAPAEGLFADRFRAALRHVTAAQLGEARSHHWHDLKLSREALRLYPRFRAKLIERHPELLAVGAGR